MQLDNATQTASRQYEAYDNKRNGIMHRLERYSSWTVPKLFPRKNRDQDTEPLTHGFQSLGAQAVNHLANKLMMSLFAPSRPFFRLDMKPKAKTSAQEKGLDLKQLQSKLAKAEQDSSLELDKRSIRSRLYDLLKMLIVLGNALMIFEKDTVRILNMRNYVVKRSRTGDVYELIIREKVHKSQIKAPALACVIGHPEYKPDDDGMVWEYKWVKYDHETKKFNEDVWICDCKLPASFSSTYSSDKLPYRAVSWDLAAGDDYGTGLVEDYEADFQSLTMLSEAAVQGAILASEFRWLVNPAGQTSVEDFTASPNGAAIPGQKGDIELINAGVEGVLSTNQALQSTYINRIGAGFLLQTVVTRNAERVTAQEIRMNAEELEGGLGGGYSRIAADVQVPVAYWVMALTGRDIIGKDIEPVIITGLAALSRTGDRDRLLEFGQNLAAVLSLPPQILDRLKLSAWISDLASAGGLDPTTYVLTEEEYNQMQQAAAQQALAMQNAQMQVENANNMETQTQ
jgi:hypothetical protein